MYVVKVVAVATVAGNPNQARNRFTANYPPRVEGAIAARGLTGTVEARIVERPDVGALVWEFYPKTAIEDEGRPWVGDFEDTYADLRDFLRDDLEAWLEGEGHTVTTVYFDP